MRVSFRSSKRARVRALAVTMAIVALVMVQSSCTVDVNVGATAYEAGIVGDSRPGDEGPTDADASDSALDKSDAREIFDAGCGVNFPQRGEWIDLLVNLGPVPRGTGGTIEPGTYRLTAIRSYYVSGTAEVRETIVIEGSPSVGTMARYSEIRNTSGAFQSQAPLAQFFTWQAQPTDFFFSNPTCPNVANNPWGAGTYSASANAITLIGQGLEYVYERTP